MKKDKRSAILVNL